VTKMYNSFLDTKKINVYSSFFRGTIYSNLLYIPIQNDEGVG